MTSKIIHQTSPDGTLSWEERNYLKHIEALLPDWEFKIWTDEANRSIVARLYPEYLDQYDRMQFGVMRADIARYTYLRVFGGIYIDTDYKLLRRPDPLIVRERCVLPIEEGRVGGADFKLGNALLASEKDHPFWEKLTRRIFDSHKPELVSSRNDIVAATGPLAITSEYLNAWMGDPSIVLPERNLFFPDRRFFGLSHAGSKDTIGYHQCWGSWRGKRTISALRNVVRRKINGLI